MPVEPLLNTTWGFDTNCFVCDPANEQGLRVPFHHDTDGGFVFAEFALPSQCSGAPTYVHGGATLALLDEAMSWATIALSEKFAFTKQTTATFDWPVLIDRTYRVEARVVAEDERTIHTEAVVLDDRGRPCVRAEAEMAVLSEAQAIDAIGRPPTGNEAKYLRG